MTTLLKANFTREESKVGALLIYTLLVHSFSEKLGFTGLDTLGYFLLGATRYDNKEDYDKKEVF